MNKNQNGKNNPNYKDGHCINNICIDCCTKIHPQAKRCRKCEDKHHSKLMKGKNHPNYGKHRPLSVRKKISLTKIKLKQSVGSNNPMFGKITHGKGSYYKNIWMRSSWEISFAKWLDKNNIKWQYESKTFDLGNTTYTPDFYVPIYATYIEIKGFWRIDAKKKFNLFKKQYPKEEIVVLQEKDLTRLNIIKRR